MDECDINLVIQTSDLENTFNPKFASKTFIFQQDDWGEKQYQGHLTRFCKLLIF